MTQVIRSPMAMQALRKTWLQQKNSLGQAPQVGFVPTMGALHHGHETLLQRARKECDLVVLSIFVNPTQFNNPNDLENYPTTWEADLAMAQKNKVDVIFFPNYKEMYPDDYKYKVIETEFSKELCGKDRPGHFDGVLSVVTKLLNIVKADFAYFGEKDFQQLQLIKGLCQAFFIETQIVPVATVREQDGLAMSSRNVRLTDEARSKAPEIYKIISTAANSEEATERLEDLGFRVDYVVDKYGRRFAAVKTEGRDGHEVRLIDNVQI